MRQAKDPPCMHTPCRKRSGGAQPIFEQVLLAVFVPVGPQGCMSYSPSSSSNSPSSSAVASWYCWYSETSSFMLDSASVNSISSIPSPVYQWRNAFLRNIAVKNSATRLNISWIAVELPKKVTAIFRPFGGISQIPVLMLFGIHSTKYDEFLFWTFNICSSTSLALIRPRNKDAAVK